mgnify:FL=1
MRFILAAVISVFASAASAEEKKWQAPFDYAEAFPKMVAPFEPFRVIGNIYYVGTEGLAVFLITGDDGHVLIDGGLPGYEQIIIDNIATLGFDIKDVRTLLNTHAHFDHSGGLAVLKKASGAKLWASADDCNALKQGVYIGYEERKEFSAPPVSVERCKGRSFSEIPHYGVWEIDLGSFQIDGWLTPGHSPGCTSWRLTVEEEAEDYEVLIFCSATVAANRLVNPPQYEGIVEDYRYTFDRTNAWEPDVFLANHPEVFLMKETREKQKTGDPLAFVNRGAFQRYRAAKEEAFEEALAEQTAAAASE